MEHSSAMMHFRFINYVPVNWLISEYTESSWFSEFKLSKSFLFVYKKNFNE